MSMLRSSTGGIESGRKSGVQGEGTQWKPPSLLRLRTRDAFLLRERLLSLLASPSASLCDMAPLLRGALSASLPQLELS